MQQFSVENAIEKINHGFGYDSLYLYLRNINTILMAKEIYIAYRRKSDVQIVASYNRSIFSPNFWSHDIKISKIFFEEINSPKYINVYCDKKYSNESAKKIITYNYPILFLPDGSCVTLTCIDEFLDFQGREIDKHLLRDGVELLSRYFRLLVELCAERPSVLEGRPAYPLRVSEAPGHYDPGVSAGLEDSSVTSRFLLETLVRKRRVLVRDNVAYTAVRTWRAPIRDWQLAALKAIKSASAHPFVEGAASELVGAGSQIAGKSAFDAITAVPCGHSGPDCLSCKLAAAVAALLNLPFRPVFDQIDVKGSSHPKTNARRPKMRLNDPAPGRYLLIDDVATSGAHISEATNLLRAAGSTVLPLVYIAA